MKRNFQGYSVETAPHLIGLGTSSVSQLNNGYVQNTSDLRHYKNTVLSNRLPITRGIALSIEDRLRKRIIEHIMCYLEVDLKTQCTLFHYPLDYFAQELRSLDPLVNDGLVSITNGIIRIHPKARQITRVVSSYFDRFFKNQAQQHSKMT